MSSIFKEDTLPYRVSQYLGHVAAALTFLVAALHLFHPSHGIERLVLLLSVDPGLLLADPRPALFVLSGIGLVVAVPAVLFGVSEKPVYVLGIILMMIYIVGYFTWHLTGHGGFLPGREPLYHGLQPHEAVIRHMIGDLWAAAAVFSEALLAGMLVALYRRKG
jgi:hypothetical protein